MANELAGASVAPSSAPAASLTPAAPTEPAAAPQDAGLPPPFSLVESGQLPAVTVDPYIRGGEHDPFQKYAVDNLDELIRQGIDYEELPSSHTVFYNPAKITGEAIQKAYKEGKLDEVAPPAGKVVQALQSAQAAPAAQPAAAPAPAQSAPPAAPAAPDAAPLAGASADAPPMDRRLQSARIQATKSPAPNTPLSPIDKVSKRAV